MRHIPRGRCIPSHAWLAGERLEVIKDILEEIMPGNGRPSKLDTEKVYDVGERIRHVAIMPSGYLEKHRADILRHECEKSELK